MAAASKLRFDCEEHSSTLECRVLASSLSGPSEPYEVSLYFSHFPVTIGGETFCCVKLSRTCPHGLGAIQGFCSADRLNDIRQAFLSTGQLPGAEAFAKSPAVLLSQATQEFHRSMLNHQIDAVRSQDMRVISAAPYDDLITGGAFDRFVHIMATADPEAQARKWAVVDIQEREIPRLHWLLLPPEWLTEHGIKDDELDAACAALGFKRADEFGCLAKLDAGVSQNSENGTDDWCLTRLLSQITLMRI